MPPTIKLATAETNSHIAVFELSERMDALESNGAHDMPKNDIESVKLFIKVSDEQINLGNSIPKWEETKNWALGINLNNISSKQSLEINQKAFEVENWLLEDGVLQKRASGGNSGASLNSPINPVSSQINGSLTNGQLSKEVSKASYTNDLFKVTLPTLIMTGKYDFVVAPELSQDAYNLISSTNKKLVVFDNSGHSPMSHEPEKYTNELIQFIDANK